MKTIKLSVIKCLFQVLFGVAISILWLFGLIYSIGISDYGHTMLFLFLFLLFGALSVSVIHLMLTRRVLIAIDESGINAISNLGIVYIEWDRIACFYLNNHKLTKGHIAVILKNPEYYLEYFRGKSKLARKIAISNIKYKGSPLWLNVSTANKAPKKIYELLMGELEAHG